VNCTEVGLGLGLGFGVQLRERRKRHTQPPLVLGAQVHRQPKLADALRLRPPFVPCEELVARARRGPAVMGVLFDAEQAVAILVEMLEECFDQRGVLDDAAPSRGAGLQLPVPLSNGCSVPISVQP
jgi:hypothetical protein